MRDTKRTTIDLPVGLFKRAKVAAAVRGTTLRQLIIDALEATVPSDPTKAAPWRRLAGGFADLEEELKGLDLAVVDIHQPEER